MRWKLLVILPFAIWIAATNTAEYLHIRGAGEAPVVEGDIINRAEYRHSGGIPGGKLTIQIVGQPATVTAITNKDAMKSLPQRVRFHYTGDPSREVFIEGEENPLWIALLLWVVSAGIILFWVVPYFLRPFPTDDDQAGQKSSAFATQ
jgi:hypothetical protein